MKKPIVEEYIGEYIAEYIEAPKTLSLVIAVTYIVSIAISCFFLNSVIKSHDKEVAKFIAADAYATLHNEILQSIMVTRTMASDSFLKENLKNELNVAPETEISVLQEYLSGINKNFGYNVTFVVSAATKNYYYNGGFNKVVDADNNPHDIWYRNFIAKKIPYATAVEEDEFNKNLWNVFITARVEDENENLIGVCGVGLSMQNLQETLSRIEDDNNVKIDLFQPEENFDIDTNAVKFKDPHLKEILANLQAQEDFDKTQFFLEQIDNIFIVARYIPEVNSYLIIRRDNSYVQGTISDVVLRIVVCSAFVLLILIIFVQVKIGKDKKNLEEEAKRQGITSHADKYAVMYLVDVKYNSAQELSRHEGFNLLKIRDGGNAERKIKNSLIFTTRYETVRGLLEFIDFSTLPERIKDKRAISYEFLSREYGWCRATFLFLTDNDKNNSRQIVFAVEVIDAQKRAAEDLKRRSETDAMTGLRNRGSGEKAITELVANGVEGMFCLMDADKFKSINDNYGHDVGDKVIKAIANALKKTFRHNDIVMRLGGDEYAVYAVGVTDEEYGASIIKRLFKAIDDIHIEELGERKITISLGSSLFHAEEKISFDELYKRADLATYESKKIQGNFHTAYSEKIAAREE